MKKQLLTAAVITLFANTAMAQFGYDQIDIENYDSFTCQTDSGRTVVDVNRDGNAYNINVTQDGHVRLLNNVSSELMIMERFPAGYRFADLRTGSAVLSIGQGWDGKDSFTAVSGTVHYNKLGEQMSPEVTCYDFEKSGGLRYISLENVELLECLSESGRTKVTVTNAGNQFVVNAVQDGRRVLINSRLADLAILERFPAGYDYYEAGASNKRLLTLGQSWDGENTFSKVKGTVFYRKNLRTYETPVSCDVVR